MATFIIVIRRSLFLAFFPYKTMRKISEDHDMSQVFLIWIFIAFYFLWANTLRQYPYEPFILYLMTVFHFIATIIYFFLATQVFHNYEIQIKPFILTFTYTMIPTLLWFVLNSVLYAVLPPPRTMSILGKAFSIFFISFSVTLLLWKVILVYLAIRFSAKLTFYRILYSIIIYLAMILPYALYLYSLQFFRIPFL
jgi:hypothetical protein